MAPSYSSGDACNAKHFHTLLCFNIVFNIVMSLSLTVTLLCVSVYFGYYTATAVMTGRVWVLTDFIGVLM